MVSVVIPAYNEEKTIGACLESLVAQKTKLHFEVIVVDNNSTDRTSEIAREFSDKLRMRIVYEKRKGSGPARAAGFAKAKSDIILSTDADAVLPEDWIEALTSVLGDRHVVAVTSACKIDEGSYSHKTTFYVLQLLFMYAHRLFIGYFFISGYSYAIRRSAYIASGGIDVKLSALDDVELSKRVARVGKIAFLRKASVLASNRRYRQGLISGGVSYWKPLLKIIFLNRKDIAMQDIR